MIAELVGKRLKQLKGEGKYKGSFSPVCHFFGYQGRCSVPSRFDQNLATTYGRITQILIQNKITGYCPSVRGLEKQPQKWFPLAIPLTNMLRIKAKSNYSLIQVNLAIIEQLSTQLTSISNLTLSDTLKIIVNLTNLLITMKVLDQFNFMGQAAPIFL